MRNLVSASRYQANDPVWLVSITDDLTVVLTDEHTGYKYDVQKVSRAGLLRMAWRCVVAWWRSRCS